MRTLLSLSSACPIISSLLSQQIMETLDSSLGLDKNLANEYVNSRKDAYEAIQNTNKFTELAVFVYLYQSWLTE